MKVSKYWVPDLLVCQTLKGTWGIFILEAPQQAAWCQTGGLGELCSLRLSDTLAKKRPTSHLSAESRSSYGAGGSPGFCWSSYQTFWWWRSSVLRCKLSAEMKGEDPKGFYEQNQQLVLQLFLDGGLAQTHTGVSSSSSHLLLELFKMNGWLQVKKHLSTYWMEKKNIIVLNNLIPIKNPFMTDLICSYIKNILQCSFRLRWS